MISFGLQIPLISSIARSLRFSSLTRRFPDQRDFISMGLGIEARYQRCRKFWEKHLEYSRRFQIDALSKVAPGLRVAILGAGRLLDVPTEFLQDNNYRVALFDADPGCEKIWRRVGFDGNSNIDLSANFLSFSQCVQRNIAERQGSVASVAAALDRLELIKPSLPGAPYDVVISLNLLSQIPLYYYDYLERALVAKFGQGSDDDGVFPKPLADTWTALAQRLQRQHQALVQESARQLTVLISDRSFLYYHRDQSAWRECAALYLPISTETCASAVSDGWFWHIAPQDLEQDNFGAIHDVQARAHFY